MAHGDRIRERAPTQNCQESHTLKGEKASVMWGWDIGGEYLRQRNGPPQYFWSHILWSLPWMWLRLWFKKKKKSDKSDAVWLLRFGHKKLHDPCPRRSLPPSLSFPSSPRDMDGLMRMCTEAPGQQLSSTAWHVAAQAFRWYWSSAWIFQLRPRTSWNRGQLNPDYDETHFWKPKTHFCSLKLRNKLMAFSEIQMFYKQYYHLSFCAKLTEFFLMSQKFPS